jgi:hypothetical protein
MTRYLIKAGLWRAPIDEEWPRSDWGPTTNTEAAKPTVYQPEERTVDTGLLDEGGNRIYRGDTQRIGFLNF